MSQRFATSFTQFIPKAVLVILIAQIFSSLSFGLVLATLTPFAMHYLHISQTQAVGLTTSFLGFNFALHLVGGFIGGRFVSYRALFTVGTFLQIIACLFLTNITTSTIYFGLAAFLAGVGLNFPCINCMLLQLFKAEDKRRETAFLWNYSGISLGLLISFILISILQWRHNFSVLFFMSAASNIIVLLVIIGNWKKLADRTTLLMTFNKDTLIASFLKSILFILIIFSALFYLLQNINDGHHILILLSIIMFFLFIYFIFRQPTLQSRKRLLSCFIFAIVTVGFWTLYMSTPVLLPFFTTQAVNPRLFGLPIPLPWFSNISMLVIFIGGFLLSLLFQGVRKKGYPFTLPIQFTIALFLLFLAFVAIPIGIKMTPVNSLVSTGLARPKLCSARNSVIIYSANWLRYDWTTRPCTFARTNDGNLANVKWYWCCNCNVFKKLFISHPHR